MFSSFIRHLPRPTATVAIGALCLAGMFSAAGAAHAQGLYQAPAPTLVTGTVPQGVAAADFTRSGYQGLVVTDSTNGNMKVYLATGAATFAPAATYSACTNPTAVATADFTGDGYPGIAVACTSANRVRVFTNDGAGVFNVALTQTVTSPVALATGKFAGNLPGLAVASSSGAITVLFSQSGSLVVTTASVTGTLTGIVAGDFDHDGDLDLAVSDSANDTVHILKGDGAGNFTESGSYSTGSGAHPVGISTADFNHDGNPDLATINSGTNTATVLLGSATGTFAVQTAQATGTNPIGIAVTDVNSDGNPDVVAFDSFSSTTGAVAVLLGNGNGSLQTAQISNQSFRPGTLPAVADFNRDGKPDLATTQQNSNRVSLLLNNTLPTQYPYGRGFAAADPASIGNGNMADGVAVADFNQDGLPDIAVTYLEDNMVRVLLNAGGGPGSFSTSAPYAVGSHPYWVAAGDLNGDGYPDLVVTNTSGNTISVLLNNGNGGNGTFAAAATYAVGKAPFQVAIGDVNGDGIPDLAVTNFTDNTVSVLFGQTGGVFTPASTLSVGTGTSPYGVAIGDFSNNGFPDIAVTCNKTSQLYVFPNNGDGTFGTPFIASTDTEPGSLVTGDFNRDGKLDIVTGNTKANDVSFFAGSGNGLFAAGVISPSLNFPATIAAGDVNGDGILDIVGVAPNFNKVAVTLGVGDGTFGTFQQRGAGEFAAATQPWAVALGDFNNDGQLDIVTANTFHQVNIASPSFQARYITQYPADPGGHPSIDVLYNSSAVSISLTATPASPIPANNTDVTIEANVQPAMSGGTPTGSVIFEDSTGAPLGVGPYPLSSGVATYDLGHLGSGQYVFTTLYSGDSHFQPSTVSGAGVAITVVGTPISLTLNPTSVGYGGTVTATATATGTAGFGIPTGTATIYGINSGGTTFTIGTITLAASGNNSTGTTTFTATAPNLNVGAYQVFAAYNPTNGNYQAGTSSTVTLTVTQQATTTALNCAFGFGSTACTATVTVLATAAPVPPGNIVNFSVSGIPGVTPVNIGANGKATFNYGVLFGLFTITADFPQQGNYLESSNSVQGGCFLFFCIGGAQSQPVSPLSSFTGLNFNQRSTNRNTRRNVPFTLF